MLDNFEKYLPAIDSLPDFAGKKLELEQLRCLLMEEEPDHSLQIYYCAHTDYVNPEAKVVFIGICPGFEQMLLSLNLVRQYRKEEESEILKSAKEGARFGRSMRRNLIELADRTVLPQLLQIPGCSTLFEQGSTLMDNTALLPYPVFKNGHNYTGHSPKIDRSALLKETCQKQLERIKAAYPKAVFIPQGKCVDEQISKSGVLDENRIIHGFPHPSGANGHRFSQLEKNLSAINQSLKEKLGSEAKQSGSESSL